MNMYEIKLPKGCNCKNVGIGSYDNQVELITPKFLKNIIELSCYSFRETTCIDKCISDLVQEFWKKGIITTGSCCGHNTQNGYIGIYEIK